MGDGRGGVSTVHGSRNARCQRPAPQRPTHLFEQGLDDRVLLADLGEKVLSLAAAGKDDGPVSEVRARHEVTRRGGGGGGGGRHHGARRKGMQDSEAGHGREEAPRRSRPRSYVCAAARRLRQEDSLWRIPGLSAFDDALMPASLAALARVLVRRELAPHLSHRHTHSSAPRATSATDRAKQGALGHPWHASAARPWARGTHLELLAMLARSGATQSPRDFSTDFEPTPTRTPTRDG